MGMSTKPLVNFSGGEASPKLRGRSDTVPYFAMAETLENVLVSHYGSAAKTPGTKFVARAKDEANNVRLIPFIFSTGQSYMLEFGENYLRFYTDSGSLVETAVVITGATQADPCVITTSTAHAYTNGDYVDISGIDGMTELNGKRYIVANVTSNTFELTDEDGNDVDSTGYDAYVSDGESEKVYEITTTYTSEEVGDIKYTQQADIMWLVHPDHKPAKLSRLTANTFTLADITYDTLDIPPFQDINTTTTTITPSATTGSVTLTASVALWTSDYVGAYIQLLSGYALVTAFTDTTHVTATVINTLSGTGATADWNNGSWSEVQGYPSDVKFYEQRLYYSATDLQKLTVWGSVFGEYDNFEYGSDDDGAVTYTLGSNQVDKIDWMYPTSVLNCGTAGGPFTLSSGYNAEPITATNISVKQQNENGSSTISPVRIGSFVYYVERSKRVLGQFSYNLDTDSYNTDNITYLSDHILGTAGAKEIALQRYPYNILWCVREDGEIATLTREIKNEVKGWSRQVYSGTNAKATSVGVIPNGVEDQVWLCVERTINSSTTKYIEFVKPHEFGDKEDAWFVQSGLEYDGTDTDTITGLDHLEGETLSILVDGAVHPDTAVSGGSLTLEWEGGHVIVGLGYTSTIQTMDIEAGNQSQTSQGKVTHIGKVVIRFNNSLGCLFGNGLTTDVVKFRDSSMPQDESPPLFTGDKEVEFQSGHPKNKYIYLYQAQPLPMDCLGIFPKMLITF